MQIYWFFASKSLTTNPLCVQNGQVGFFSGNFNGYCTCPRSPSPQNLYYSFECCCIQEFPIADFPQGKCCSGNAFLKTLHFSQRFSIFGNCFALFQSPCAFQL